MKRWAIALTLITLIIISVPRKSEAGFYLNLTGSGNYNFLLNDPNSSDRYGFGVEANLGWKFLLVSLDLGVNYDFLKKEIQWRPGVKVHLGWFYIRGAIPFAYDFAPDQIFDLGILLGGGVEIAVKKFSLSLIHI